jgi:MoaA/NifB/PqqE/SkfB family radical SAM enzyme
MTVSTKSTTAWARVNEQGDLVIPQDVVTRYGLTPGAMVRLDEGTNFVRLHRPVTHLTKVYIEPTVACNLECITCFRNAWDTPQGRMSDETFDAIFASLKKMDPIPNVYFGGIGEPLFHPHTLQWVKKVKSLGVKVEMITNATMLTEKIARKVIDSGLDVLWVSLDGASPETYSDVRLGAEFPHVMKNLHRFNSMRKGGHSPHPELGIAFVAMARNIQELPKIIRLGRGLRVKHFSVSNLQPATDGMQVERLYDRSLRDIAYMNAGSTPNLSIPKMDLTAETRDALFDAFTSGCNVNFAGNNWGGASDVCNFVESGTMSINWQGDAAPCWPLMHTHDTFLHNKPHRNHKHIIGNVRERSLEELWLDEEYMAYRERLHNFAFAPCTFCGGCELSEENVEDCFSNPAPVCGVCLWAQGVIQCP